MPKTNLERKSSYYERVIKAHKDSALSGKYEAVYTSLGKLVSISKKLNNPTTKMNPQEFKDLKANYSPY